MTEMTRETDEEYRRELGLILARAVLPILVELGVVLVIVKRDDITRLCARLKGLLTHQREQEREDTEVAKFRREMTVWEHEEMGR